MKQKKYKVDSFILYFFIMGNITSVCWVYSGTGRWLDCCYECENINSYEYYVDDTVPFNINQFFSGNLASITLSNIIIGGESYTVTLIWNIDLMTGGFTVIPNAQAFVLTGQISTITQDTTGNSRPIVAGSIVPEEEGIFSFLYIDICGVLPVPEWEVTFICEEFAAGDYCVDIVYLDHPNPAMIWTIQSICTPFTFSTQAWFYIIQITPTPWWPSCLFEFIVEEGAQVFVNICCEPGID